LSASGKLERARASALESSAMNAKPVSAPPRSGSWNRAGRAPIFSDPAEGLTENGLVRNPQRRHVLAFPTPGQGVLRLQDGELDRSVDALGELEPGLQVLTDHDVQLQHGSPRRLEKRSDGATWLEPRNRPFAQVT
jgi:hypothetical protein